MDWTPQQDAALLKGLKQKLSASQIASRLRVSRNAVIGRSHRLRGTRFSCDERRKEDALRYREETQQRREARRRLHERVISRMLATIVAGKPRNQAIVAARKQGATQRVVAEALGISVSRIGQIVDASNLAA